MSLENPVKIFGHQGPDTDTVVSAIVYAWYYNQIKGEPAQAYVLGELNKETKYVLDRFGFDTPPMLENLTAEDRIVVVDTNNFDELPNEVQDAQLIEIVDHHKLTGTLSTLLPISITMRPMASTASLIYTFLNPEIHEIPQGIAGLMLAALLSDTLEFRSPTTTEEDRQIGTTLAKLSGVDVSELAKEMFVAKSDLSDIPAAELIVMDSKIFDLNNQKIRVGVLETTDPDQVFARQDDLIKAMDSYKNNDSEADDIVLFVVDILKSQATPMVASDEMKQLIEKAFSVSLETNVVLPGVVSRKKQIIPALSRV